MTAVCASLREAEDEVLRRTEEQKQVQLLASTVEDNLDSIEKELARLDSRSGGEEGKLQALRQQLQQQTDAQASLQSRQDALTAQQTAMEQTLQRSSDAVTALRMDEASIEAACAAAQNTIAQLQSAQRGHARRRDAEAGADCGISDADHRAGTEKDGLRGRDPIGAAAAGAGAAGSEGRRRRRARSLRRKRNQTEKQAQEKNQGRSSSSNARRARLEQKKATSELEEKQIVDRLWDSYELTPGTAEAETVQIESLTGGRQADRRGPPEDLRTWHAEPRCDRRICARIGALRRISRRQRDDVLKAKSELEAIVGSITTEMTEIFVREFARIDDYFGKTFTEMFGGGKASLILEDPSAPLECGIEIRVQPPGKQVKTITLLSGGEKAFVAIALYFAILKVRPDAVLHAR